MARNLSPYSGNDVFSSLHREMNRIFDDAFRGFGVPSQYRLGQSQGRSPMNMLQPDIDVSETEKEIKICADLPGVSEKDVDVMLDDNVLTIKAERKQERNEQKEDYHIVERNYGTFQRSLQLPSTVDPEQVQAKFEHGVLTVVLPKTEQGQRQRRIEVQGRGQGQGQQGQGQERMLGQQSRSGQQQSHQGQGHGHESQGQQRHQSELSGEAGPSQKSGEQRAGADGGADKQHSGAQQR